LRLFHKSVQAVRKNVDSCVTMMSEGNLVFNLKETFLKIGFCVSVLMSASSSFAYNQADPNLNGGYLPGGSAPSFNGGVSSSNSDNIAIIDVIRAMLPSGAIATNASTSTVLPEDKTARLTDQTVRPTSSDDPTDDTAQ
jgi:hypothetical protein